MRNLIQSSVICEEINFLASEIKSLPRRDKEVRLEPNQVGKKRGREKKKSRSHRLHLEGGDDERACPKAGL